MKIGIMGGTFDPIHNGHLMLGEAAYEAFELDQIWFLPNGNPPHKKNSRIEADASDRVTMTRLAVSGVPYFRVETYEARRKEVSCTYRTLEYFHEKYPNDQMYFIIGADSLFSIESWVHPERIFPRCTILAAYRDEVNSRKMMEEKIWDLQEKYHADIRLLVTPLMHVASHELRQLIKKGQDISPYVPEPVVQYIKEHGLYRTRNQKRENECL